MPLTAYLHSSVHISACLEQHTDCLHTFVVAGNVEGGSPSLQCIPIETRHGPLHLVPRLPITPAVMALENALILPPSLPIAKLDHGFDRLPPSYCAHHHLP